MEKIIYFVRHGESSANIGLPSGDPASIALTEKGKRQAHLVANCFSYGPELIVHSPYTRTLETATPLIERFPEAQVEEWPIHEFTYLDTKAFSGTTGVERKAQVEKYWNTLNPDYIDGYDAESFSQMIERIRTCLKRVENTEASLIVIYCHGQIMHALSIVAREKEASDREIMTIFKQEKQAGYEPKNTETWETGIREDGTWLPLKTVFSPKE